MSLRDRRHQHFLRSLCWVIVGSRGKEKIVRKLLEHSPQFAARCNHNGEKPVGTD